MSRTLRPVARRGGEFVLAGENNYPDDYPELDTDITVTDVFESYTEDGYVYYHLANAHMDLVSSAGSP